MQHLSITQQGSNTGLFGYASRATMQNICIDGNFTLTTTSYTEGYGSIAGCVVSSTISNCHSSVNFTINTEMDASVNCIGHIGGIVGKMNETSSTDSNVSGCSYSGTINLGNNKVNVAAGIAGYAMRRFLILDTGNEKQEGSEKSEAPDEPLPKTEEERLAELERRMEEQESRLANLETRLSRLEID